ncbi:hypothetical protein ACFV0C_22470 [Streptomyces sp. NPDC059568]|uniref:hypothetical protein n=1 Tax=Streptomyces sp. NPDC059568 TaxID=3346868 RepID=UPI00367C7C20
MPERVCRLSQLGTLLGWRATMLGLAGLAWDGMQPLFPEKLDDTISRLAVCLE